MDQLLISDEVFVHPNMGLMVIDAADRYALPVFGCVEALVEDERIIVWEGDAPTKSERELLKRYE